MSDTDIQNPDAQNPGTTPDGATIGPQETVPAAEPFNTVSQTPDESASIQVAPVQSPQIVPEVTPQDGVDTNEILNPLTDPRMDADAEPSVDPSTYAAPINAPIADLPHVFDAYSHSTSATPGASTDTTTPERFPHEIDALLAPPTAASIAANS